MSLNRRPRRRPKADPPTDQHAWVVDPDDRRRRIHGTDTLAALAQAFRQLQRVCSEQAAYEYLTYGCRAVDIKSKDATK